ncbi:carboxypeptidase-like regulatory domain-containing protein [Sinomonas sp. ASV322]|uniref:carboxypeptidase-like regulatory domain-containing protein n=1 Tax=Sinomonas sp. ASV322 TaxID=3041920 RepID=UPI0027DEA9AC|nr:carboxypeptidase-like regulatory domain-containing protein [Sinomonas sp. ASV322]MDQ4504314.1 carboxypeptidase-like regulatory domain-containing protein [Sinomonas sp. ASV322]
MRPGTALGTAIIAAALLLASCGNGTPGGGGTGASGGGSATATSATVSAGTIRPGTAPPSPPPSSTTTPLPTATSTPPLEPPSGAGAYGYVTAGPTCPVERPDQPCPPRPVSAAIDARDSNGTTVASTHSDSFGRYTLGLSPGSYVLVVVTSNGWPRCPETRVAVQPGVAVRADISCDTGIR